MRPILAIPGQQSKYVRASNSPKRSTFKSTFAIGILRIIALAPTFALISFLAGSVPSAAIYLQPWADAYEAVALTSYFLLLVVYAVPDSRLRDDFFERLPQPNSGEGSLRWYRVSSAPVSKSNLNEHITQAAGKYCTNGHSVHFAHTWLTAIRTISVILAFLRLLRFYSRLSSTLKPYSVVPKLIAIKGIVFLSTSQSLLFTIVSATGAAKPSSKISYNDIYFGVPSILTCGEMILFSLLNFYAYSLTPYVSPSSSASNESQPLHCQASYQGGPLGMTALLTALEPTEIARGLVLAIQYLLSSSQSQRYDSMPLYGGSNNTSPTPALLPHGRYEQPSGIERAHSPNGVEYGRVERYTPLPK